MKHHSSESVIHVSGPSLSIVDIEAVHPGSVWASIISYADWLSKLDISNRAKRLTRLRGKHFIKAVDRILS
jgi:hypothetical protein